MADPDREKDEGAGDEVDVARAAIYFLGILLLGLVVVLFVLWSKRDEYRTAVEYGERNLKKMAVTYDQVKGLLKQYGDSGAEVARRSTQTWLKDRYTNANIQDSQVTTEKWSERPSKDHIEHSVDVVVKGVQRQHAIQFLWNVEKMSTKMRTIEMKLVRTAPNNQPEADVWELRATFGYRVPRGMKDGS